MTLEGLCVAAKQPRNHDHKRLHPVMLRYLPASTEREGSWGRFVFSSQVVPLSAYSWDLQFDFYRD